MSEYERRLNYRRSLGVSRAWKCEKGVICRGRGTREWALREQKILLENGRIKGYQGHHIKSVARYPEYADEPNNVQFLCSSPKNNEHLRAHGGDYRNETNGMYDVRTGRILPLPPGRPGPLPEWELREKAIRKRGYTRYADKSVSHTPRRKKAQTQVTFEGRTYTRTMIQTGKSAQSGAKAPKTQKPSAAAKRSSPPVWDEPTVKRSGASSVRSGLSIQNEPTVKRSSASSVRSGLTVQNEPTDRKSGGVRVTVRETETQPLRGSVRQMIREMKRRSENRTKGK